MSNKANAYKRAKHLSTIKEFLDEAGLKWEYIHGFEWHIRVEGQIDIFPTNKKYHVLKNDIRGTFDDYDELGRIFMENF